jgi:hypothetical protein
MSASQGRPTGRLRRLCLAIGVGSLMDLGGRGTNEAALHLSDAPDLARDRQGLAHDWSAVASYLGTAAGSGGQAKNRAVVQRLAAGG